MISFETYTVTRATMNTNVLEMGRSVRFLHIFTPEYSVESIKRQCERLEEYAANITRLAKELREAL